MIDNKNELKQVGYWRQKENSNEPLPWPSSNIRHLPDDTKHKIILYLTNGKEYAAWMGFSMCRLCGCINGTTCRTDGKFVWPEGYAHYIDKHDVAVDPELLAHILTQ